MNAWTLRHGRILMGRLPHGADLLTALNEFCSRNGVSLGELTAIGAVKRGRFGFYDQSAREYRYLEMDKHLEIVSLLGNVSVKDGKPFVHAHIALMNEKGNVYGGHLVEGNTVFACEFIVKEFSSDESATFSRVFDDQTGLYLWPK